MMIAIFAFYLIAAFVAALLIAAAIGDVSDSYPEAHRS